jgi:hypothetical protein
MDRLVVKTMRSSPATLVICTQSLVRATREFFRNADPSVTDPIPSAAADREQNGSRLDQQSAYAARYGGDG